MAQPVFNLLLVVMFSISSIILCLQTIRDTHPNSRSLSHINDVTVIIPKNLQDDSNENVLLMLLGSTNRIFLHHVRNNTNFKIKTVAFKWFKRTAEQTHSFFDLIMRNVFLIPTKDSASEDLANEMKHLRELGYKFLTATPAIIEYLGDKLNLQRNTEKSLQKYLPEEYINASNAKFPCFLKKRSGAGSHAVHLIENEQQYENVINKIPEYKRSNWFLQQSILGNEYSVLALVVNGKIVVIYTKVIINMKTDENDAIFVNDGSQRVKAQKGELAIHNVNTTKNVLMVFERFLVGYNGMVGIDFKLLNDEPIIFEFNTRLTAQIYQRGYEELQHLLTQYILNSY